MPFPEEASLGLRREAAHRSEMYASDAWDAALLAEAGDVPELLLDEDAGRLAGRAPDARERVALQRKPMVAAAAAESALCTRDAARSAERSCAAVELGAGQGELEQRALPQPEQPVRLAKPEELVVQQARMSPELSPQLQPEFPAAQVDAVLLEAEGVLV